VYSLHGGKKIPGKKGKGRKAPRPAGARYARGRYPFLKNTGEGRREVCKGTKLTKKMIGRSWFKKDRYKPELRGKGGENLGSNLKRGKGQADRSL